jgi:hypothetical protein
MIAIRELPRNIANMVQSYEEEDISVGSGESRQVIGTLRKVRLINRKEALDSLARTQGLFIAKPKSDGKEAKIYRIPEPMNKADWQKKHGKA